MFTDYKIFDFHCHPYVLETENICSYKDERPNSPKEFLACMDRAGIGGFAGSVVGRMTDITFEKVHEFNVHALELRDEFGGRYVPGIHIHPDFVRESCDELEAMKNKGVKLVGELVPYMMGWNSYSSKEAIEIFNVAGELGMVVSAHPTNDDDMEAMVKACPNTTIVFAHPGERGAYEKHIERMKKYKNCYLDICGTGLFRYAMLAYGVNQVGEDRLLFGTDFPVCSASMQVGGVLGEYLSDSAYEAVFHGNAERLLGM